MERAESEIKFKIQKRVALLSVVLLVGKFLAYQLTNSVGILTDALESIANVVAAFVTLYSLKISLIPSDTSHPFGHGKIESLSASLEGLLIIFAGFYIIIEAITRLFNPTVIKDIDIGIYIVAAAGLANYIMGYYSIINGRKHSSIALVAAGKHLQSDTYTTIGLVTGLVILYFTGKHWIDSAIALVLGAIIIRTGYKILRETTANLMDAADIKLLIRITNILWFHRRENWIDLNKLRLIKNGNNMHLYGDLTLPWYMNIADGHKELDLLKEVITSKINENMEVTIHSDACYKDLCSRCMISSCTKRASEFKRAIKWKVDNFTRVERHR